MSESEEQVITFEQVGAGAIDQAALPPGCRPDAADLGAFVSSVQAKSGRSTCRSTGEPIASGEWRVGFPCFIGGRMSIAWMVSKQWSLSLHMFFANLQHAARLRA
jgi:hypothetical protein